MENSSSDANNEKRPSPTLFNIENIFISIVGMYLHYEEMFLLKSKFDVNFSSFLFTQSTIIAIISYLSSIKTPDWIDKKSEVIKFVYRFVITLLISNVLQTLVWVYFNKALYFVCYNFAHSMEASLYGTALPRIRPITEWFKIVPYYVIRNTVALFIFYKTLSLVGVLNFIIPRKHKRQSTQSASTTQDDHTFEVPQAQPEVTLIFLPDNVTKYFAHKSTRAGRERSASRVYDLRPRAKKNQSHSRDRKSTQR